jgi:hypothetical protein
MQAEFTMISIRLRAALVALPALVFARSNGAAPADLGSIESEATALRLQVGNTVVTFRKDGSRGGPLYLGVPAAGNIPVQAWVLRKSGEIEVRAAETGYGLCAIGNQPAHVLFHEDVQNQFGGTITIDGIDASAHPVLSLGICEAETPGRILLGPFPVPLAAGS